MMTGEQIRPHLMRLLDEMEASTREEIGRAMTDKKKQWKRDALPDPLAMQLVTLARLREIVTDCEPDTCLAAWYGIQAGGGSHTEREYRLQRSDDGGAGRPPEIPPATIRAAVEKELPGATSLTRARQVVADRFTIPFRRVRDHSKGLKKDRTKKGVR